MARKPSSDREKYSTSLMAVQTPKRITVTPETERIFSFRLKSLCIFSP
jgi:hypothetical protein